MNFQFAPAHNVVMEDDNSCQNFLTGVHFPDLNSNSYNNVNNMKLDLSVSTKVKFSANDQGLLFKNQVN